MSGSGFPNSFLWGAATSAYQIEGSPLANGAGPSNWHRFAHTPGRTHGGETGDVACDHYRLWESDVSLMATLGLRAYRFSISWSRILPEGRGAINAAGLDFYSRLVDKLIEHEIVPCATLFHWDLPAALEDQGGWLNRDIADWFADYARVAFRRLGDRVPLWATLNEPWVVTDAGYMHGTHAPGHRSPVEAGIAAHNLLRAHGAAARACRTEGAAAIGLVVNLEPKDAASPSDLDRLAVERSHQYMNEQFLDPIYLGRYPSGLSSIYGADWSDRAHRDLDLIRTPIDFLGINYYKRGVMRHEPGSPPLGFAEVHDPAELRSALGWGVHPQGLTRTLTWVRDRYGSMPIYVTENGAAFYDPPTVGGGRIVDPLRLQYLRVHLNAAREALELGVDLRGYFVWSLMDNFEWSAGYSMRFGIVHVDYTTQRRTPKASAEFYRKVIESNGDALNAPFDLGSI